MRLLITFIFLFYSIIGSTCSCFGPADFCSTISQEISSPKFVIKGKKIRDVEHGMEVEVLKSYRNEIEENTIFIWGDLGWLCRTYTSGFAVGDTFIFSLYQVEDSEIHPLERPNDFVLSVCGQHYLFIQDDSVIGFINQSDEVQTVDLSDFESFLEKNDCSVTESNDFTDKTIVSPNPFVDDILIESNHKITEIELYDITGKLIFEDKTDDFFYNLESTHFYLTSGMYLLKIIGNMSEDIIIKIIKV